MAKTNKPKVVRVAKKEQSSQADTNQRRTRPTESRRGSSATTTAKAEDMIFGKDNYILMGAGLVLIIIGFLLMSGGAQPDDSWNPDEIYSFRRTVLAPIVILAGLVVEIFAIFKK